MKAYQLKIAIKDTHPPIWRRCIIPAGYSFSQLSFIFNEIMGWSGYHLSSFKFNKLNLEFTEDTEEDMPMWYQNEVLEASEYLIDEFVEQVKSFIYIYDFGDYWEHQVTVEEILEDYEKNYPVVIKYKGGTPREDCGGVLGYAYLKEVLEDPENEEYEDLMEWSAGSAESEYDLEVTNDILSSMYLSRKTSKPMKQEEIENSRWRGNGFKRIIPPEHKQIELGSFENILHEKDPISAIMRNLFEQTKEWLMISPEEAMREMTMMLLYLSRMRNVKDGSGADRSWKTYPFDIMDGLEEEGMIFGSHKAKSIYISEEGLEYARKLLDKYRIKDWE